ncbi:type IX secretion system membrane protein PorP/SprF [Gangjinia marincola]|uniref:Type IX secretion system membrane protein PorP/SprF n=2 Tax=Gangjinia marincola TaxID=578463 RepID=A0ABN1MFP4_9FLAO
MCYAVNAQQDAQYTQYMYNTMSFNPGYAGTRGVFSGLGLHRSQWVGLDGAPRTQTFSAHSPIGIGKIGVGFNLTNDEIFITRETYFDAIFSYNINVTEETKLSFGVKAGAQLLDNDFNRLVLDEKVDPSYLQQIDNRLLPQIGLGAYMYNNNYYVGLSAPNLLENDHFEDSDGVARIAKERVNFYLMGGYVFQVNDDLKLKPAVLSKIVSGAPLQLDLSLNALMYEKFTLGGAYRLSAAWSAMAGFQFSDAMMIGFAYDRETTELAQFNSGSFEVFLRFELFRQYGRILNPRFF